MELWKGTGEAPLCCYEYLQYRKKGEDQISVDELGQPSPLYFKTAEIFSMVDPEFRNVFLGLFCEIAEYLHTCQRP